MPIIDELRIYVSIKQWKPNYDVVSDVSVTNSLLFCNDFYLGGANI